MLHNEYTHFHGGLHWLQLQKSQNNLLNNTELILLRSVVQDVVYLNILKIFVFHLLIEIEGVVPVQYVKMEEAKNTEKTMWNS